MFKYVGITSSILIQSLLTLFVNLVYQKADATDAGESVSIIPKNMFLVVILNYCAIFIFIAPVYYYFYRKSGEMGIYKPERKMIIAYIVYAIISNISDVANLYALTGLDIRVYLVLVNLYIPASAIFAKLILGQTLTGLQWTYLILITLGSLLIEFILEPTLVSKILTTQATYYLALLTTIILDAINMNLLAKQLNRIEAEYQALTVPNKIDTKSIVDLVLLYLVCSSFTLLFYLCSLFWVDNSLTYTNWIYYYPFLYAANTLMYVFIIKFYDAIIFTLSGVISVIWSLFLAISLISISIVLSICSLFTLIGLYIQTNVTQKTLPIVSH